jgi:hypothetical protein
VTLVVYSAQGYDKVMTAAFQKATGIPVKLDDNSTGPLLPQIEASTNNPNWGLLRDRGHADGRRRLQQEQGAARRPATAPIRTRPRRCRPPAPRPPRQTQRPVRDGEPEPAVIAPAGQALGSEP